MSDVTLIGLGAMGSALAKALIGAGHSITVWNRSPERLDDIVALGARRASDVLEAVKSSNVILVCVKNYTVTRNFLETEDVLPHLRGKTLVQMGTGTPNEARENEAWMKSHGGDYLDVTIQSYPEGIGEKDSRFFISGSNAAYELSLPFLKNFGGDLRYLGDNVAAANTLDLSELIYSLGMFVGFAHAARVCETEGVGLDHFASIFHEGEPARHLADMVHADNYTVGAIHPGASVRVWEEVVQLMQDHANASGINDEVPSFVSRLFKRTMSLGYGEEDVAALVKALR
jgi:3-hydroxyisobutyrate dehydrogenase-like beta-hydroxyacid dehydrogenase